MILSCVIMWVRFRFRLKVFVIVVMRVVPGFNDAKFSKLKAHLDKMRNTIAEQFLNEDFNDSST